MDSILDRKWKCSEFFIRILKYLQSIFCCYCAGVRALRTRFCTYFSGRSENPFPACSNKQRAKRVCLAGRAHLSRGDKGLFNEPTQSEWPGLLCRNGGRCDKKKHLVNKLGKVGEVKLLTHLKRRDCKYSNITLQCRYLCLYDRRDAGKPPVNCVHSCLCSFGLSLLQPGSPLLPPHRRYVWIVISRRPLFSSSQFFPLASHWGVFLTSIHQTHVSTCSKKTAPNTFKHYVSFHLLRRSPASTTRGIFYRSLNSAVQI